MCEVQSKMDMLLGLERQDRFMVIEHWRVDRELEEGIEFFSKLVQYIRFLSLKNKEYV